MTPVLFIHCTKRMPFVDLIIGGLKLYETRTRNTLKSMLTWALGKRILIAETGHGDPVVRCSAIIDEVIAVYTREEWEEYLQFTWVPVGSEYDWKPDTKVKWLYHLTDVKPVVPFRLGPDCRRHGRVWAELPDLYNVDYQNTGGSVLCYSAIYKGMYWIFGNESYINAYTIDPLNEIDGGGPDGKYDGDPNPYEIETATEFPTWRDVLNSIPDSLVGFYWKSRSAMNKWYKEWHGSLNIRVNED